MSPAESQRRTIQRLAQEVQRIERSHGSSAKRREVVSTGIAALDGLLPDGGWRRGSLVEWLVPAEGSGAESLVFGSLRHSVPSDGLLMVVDQSREFSPPAASRLGVDLHRMIVVRPTRPEDVLWAIEQCLRCPGVAAVVGWPQIRNDVEFRRLQLAAESGTSIGFLFRSAQVRSQPSWADLRLLVDFPPPPEKPPPASQQPHRRLCVKLLRYRGGACGDGIGLEIDDETGSVRLASRMAAPAPAVYAAGA